jgi:hypothetical protein
MQQIFTSLKQVLHRSILLLVMIGLLMLSGLSITQPSYAATPNQKLTQFDKMDKQSQPVNQTASQRENAYEEQLEAAKDPDKVYEENLKEFKESHPGENIVEKAVEGAKDAVEKVTGK